MRALILTSAIAIAACTNGADARENEGGGGRTASRDFQVGSFEKVALRGSHDVIVTVGGAPSVRAEGDADAIDRLEISVEDGELRIGTERHSGWSFGGKRDRHKVVIHVTVPALAGASLAGSGDIRIDKVEGDRFAGSIAGSGDLDIAAVRVGRADFSIAGSGGITAKGAADSSNISIAGSGSIDAGGLVAKTAKVSVAGSGDVRANATETADVSVMGSGDVTMSGSARCKVSKMGSGNVSCPG